MENITAYLTEGQKLTNEIAAREEAIAHLQNLEAKIKRNGQVGIQSLQIKAMIDEYACEVVRLLTLRHHIAKIVGEMPDGMSKAVLQCRYIDGMTWEKIADKVIYSVMQVHRYHNKGIQWLEENDVR